MSRKFKFILIGLAISMLVGPGAWAYSLGELANEFAIDDAAGLIVNPDGRGDALIFPYYDVRNVGGKGQTSLFMIINESATGGGQEGGTGDGETTGIIARVGFREWDKSIEVLDFHIYLSTYDVWIGQVTLNGNVGNIKSPDFVVVGVYDPTNTAVTTPSTGVAYYLNKPFATTGQNFTTLNINYTPPAGVTKEQLTQMGYIEVIGEEAVAIKPTAKTGTTMDTGQPYTHYVKFTDLDCPNNMMGSLYVLRISDGVSMAYNATALANFSRNQGSLFRGLGEDFPTLENAEDTLDQVEFALSKEDIFGAYDIETAIGATSSLLVMFPTKHFHYNNQASGCRTLIVGSNNPFEAACENGGEEIGVQIFDRNENVITIQEGFISPQPPIPSVALPYEVNIIGFYPGTTAPPTVGGSFFGAGRDNIAFPVSTFDSGWVWLTFSGKGAVPVLIPFYQFFGRTFDGYDGLPSLALQIQEFFNGAAGGYYGDIVPSWYEVEWFPEEDGQIFVTGTGSKKGD